MRTIRVRSIEKHLLAAEQGDASSQYVLGKFYEQGQRLGFEYNKIDGIDADNYWYQQAADGLIFYIQRITTLQRTMSELELEYLTKKSEVYVRLRDGS